MKKKKWCLRPPEGDPGHGHPPANPWVAKPNILPSDPEIQVSRHLSKLFDSLCKLKFRLDASGKPLKFGLGMYSKEDEYVDFDQECDLSGQVRAAAGTHRALPLGWQRPVARTARPQRGCQQQPVAGPLSSSLGLTEQMLKGRLSRSPCTALPRQSEVTCEKKERRNEGGEREGENRFINALKSLLFYYY